MTRLMLTNEFGAAIAVVVAGSAAAKRTAAATAVQAAARRAAAKRLLASSLASTGVGVGGTNGMAEAGPRAGAAGNDAVIPFGGGGSLG